MIYSLLNVKIANTYTRAYSALGRTTKTTFHYIEGSSAIKNILGHSNLDITERYIGSFDTYNTDEILLNVFVKKETSAVADESEKSMEKQAIEQLKGFTPEQIMAVNSTTNNQYSPLINN